MQKMAVRNLRLCTKDCLCLYVCPAGATDTENSIIEFAKSEVKVWECRNCGHIAVGTAAPEICSACAHPQAYFEINCENY